MYAIEVYNDGGFTGYLRDADGPMTFTSKETAWEYAERKRKDVPDIYVRVCKRRPMPSQI